jgi:hypothetical protein
MPYLVWWNKKLDNKRFKHKEKQQNIIIVFTFPKFSKRSYCQTIGTTTQTFIKIMQNGLLRVERGCLPHCIK